MAPKRALRRPAAAGAARRMARPAARVVRAGPSKKLSEVPVAGLNQLGIVWFQKAKYYQREIEVVASVKGVVLDGPQVFLDVEVLGTKDDEFLRVVSGRADRRARVHVCDAGCNDVLTGELLVHGRDYSQVNRGDEAWFTNLEAVGVPPEEEEDELAKLRLELARRDKEAEEKEAKKAKGKKEKKRRKKEKDSSQAGGKEKKSKGSGDEGEEEEALEKGQKTLRAVFSQTGLDPDLKRRMKILRRARRLATSKKKKKKKKSGSSKGSGTGSGSDSSSEEEDETGLFDSDKKPRLIAKRYPGALTCNTLSEAKESLMMTSGMTWNVNKNELAPLATHFVRQQLASSMSPPVLQEALTLAASVDALLQGKVAFACDVLSQRLKSLEALSHGAHWSVGRQMEIVNNEGQTMAEDQEALEAARRAREAEKLRTLTSSGGAARGSDNYGGGKNKKGKGGKGGGKGRPEEGKGGKQGDGKREDKPGSWQDKKKRD